MKRLFFALWPDDNTRLQCLNIREAIDSGKIKPVHAANLHVTLVFLGNVAADKEIALRQAVANIFVPEITLRFNKLSFWKKPGILCLTATGLCPELISLVDHLSTLARKLDIKIDERAYQPHVTLAKKVKEPDILEFEPITWRSNAFCLVESCTLLSGVQYRIVEQWVMDEA